MEIVFGVVVVIVLLILIGKLKGAPDPSTMSVQAILQRLQSEHAWITKYRGLAFNEQQSPKLKQMYEEKATYIQQLEAQLAKHQKATGTQAIQDELLPILTRATELVGGGMPEAEAKAQALKEWHAKNQ